jgi:hypothetical protein
MNTYEESKATELLAAQKQAHDDEDRDGLNAVFKAYPQLVRNQAVESILRSYCGEQPVNLDVVVYGLTHDNLLSRLVVITDEEARKVLIEKLVALQGGSEQAKAHLRKSLEARVGKGYQQIYSTQELAHRAEQKQKEVDLRAMKPHEVQKLVQTSTDPSIVGHTIAAANAENLDKVFIDGQWYERIPDSINKRTVLAWTPAEQRAANRKWNARQVERAFARKG